MGARFVDWRQRGVETGGAEVDLVTESIGAPYLLIQVQSKASAITGRGRIDREVGVASSLKSNAILFVTAKRVGLARRLGVRQPCTCRRPTWRSCSSTERTCVAELRVPSLPWRASGEPCGQYAPGGGISAPPTLSRDVRPNVLASAPLATTGDRTRARLRLSANLLSYDQIEIANLIVTATASVIEISTVGADADPSLRARTSIEGAKP
jgi:hypothetical protein